MLTILKYLIYNKLSLNNIKWIYQYKNSVVLKLGEGCAEKNSNRDKSKVRKSRIASRKKPSHAAQKPF